MQIRVAFATHPFRRNIPTRPSILKGIETEDMLGSLSGESKMGVVSCGTAGA